MTACLNILVRELQTRDGGRFLGTKHDSDIYVVSVLTKYITQNVKTSRSLKFYFSSMRIYTITPTHSVINLSTKRDLKTSF